MIFGLLLFAGLASSLLASMKEAAERAGLTIRLGMGGSLAVSTVAALGFWLLYASGRSARGLDKRAEEYREIDEALNRIEKGTFGICENCKGRISEERIRTVPYGRLCGDCAAKTV